MNQRITCALTAALALCSGSTFAQSLTDRVSVQLGGGQTVLASGSPAITADGNFIAFATTEALDPMDTNGVSDIYVYDRVAGTVSAASVNTAGFIGNAASVQPSVAMSVFGLVVAFASDATNLGTDNGLFRDIYVNRAGVTFRASIDPTNTIDANGASQFPQLSGDGLYVSYETDASNINSVGPDTNGFTDVYLASIGVPVGTVSNFLVSEDNSASQGNGPSGGGTFPASSASETGRYVAFTSSATNLVASDTNGVDDIFVRDLQAGSTVRVSRSSAGVEGNGNSSFPSISWDGNRVAFQSSASNLITGAVGANVFLHDVASGGTSLVSKHSDGSFGNGASGRPSISGDGRQVAFDSLATNMVSGDTNAAFDVFVHNSIGSTTRRASLDSTGVQSNGTSYGAALDHDGAFVAFTSAASNLVAGDTNGVEDVFLRGCDLAPVFYCTTQINSLGCVPEISFNGSPSNSVATGFEISTANLINGSVAIQIYSTAGAAANPFAGGGTVCVAAPSLRSAPFFTGGTVGGPDCTGIGTLDFNGIITTSPALTLGVTVWTQCWSRDVAAANGSNLSDALEFTICD